MKEKECSDLNFYRFFKKNPDMKTKNQIKKNKNPAKFQSQSRKNNQINIETIYQHFQENKIKKTKCTHVYVYMRCNRTPKLKNPCC